MTTHTIDRQRAKRALAAAAVLTLAALPFLIGLAARLVWRVLAWVWLATLWLLGAALAGWDYGKGRNS